MSWILSWLLIGRVLSGVWVDELGERDVMDP